jgi:hypothetical protein
MIRDSKYLVAICVAAFTEIMYSQLYSGVVGVARVAKPKGAALRRGFVYMRGTEQRLALVRIRKRHHHPWFPSASTPRECITTSEAKLEQLYTKDYWVRFFSGEAACIRLP